ncbi:MAG TPA: glycosyltransferase family 87 protein [Mucilaginibacter sp.]|nr:glycosyltransferase family 87 protein [Mucilaginibacter sp.]
MQKLKAFFTNPYVILFLWFVPSLLAVVKGIYFGDGTTANFNNYIIYKHNFLNVIHQHPLFGPESQFYFDLNHYGPVFALVIAPFALLPDHIGVILWTMFNAWILYQAVMMLPMKREYCLLILLINANSMVGSSGNVEVNPLITALIIFSYVFIKRKQDFWAALAIVLGTAIKLYGIVGLAFFFFSENKLKFILSFLFWSAVLFVLPMLISSPSYIIKTYQDWYPDLVAKNAANVISNRADRCVMGMITKIFGLKHLSNLVVLLPALLLLALSYMRIKFWQNTQYQLQLLASVLIFTVIYSTGSEPPTYIIAFIGVGIWFMNLKRPITAFEWCLFFFALIVTSFSNSDIIPQFIRVNYILPYALIALPCLIIWLKIIYEMLTRRFNKGQLAT